jgi:hypothetical protein
MLADTTELNRGVGNEGSGIDSCEGPGIAPDPRDRGVESWEQLQIRSLFNSETPNPLSNQIYHSQLSNPLSNQRRITHKALKLFCF